MFVAQAHSFAQQARLAITLAWIAGYTNILTVLTCATVTSHVSGTASNLGEHVAQRNWGIAAFSGFLLLAFFVGAAIAGFTTELGRRRGWESIYVIPMGIEALLLTVFAFGVEIHEHQVAEQGLAQLWMVGVASMAMGVQNATITRISSGVVRTTHMTGIVTDLGLEAVQFVWSVADQDRAGSRAIHRRSFRETVRGLAANAAARRLVLLGSILAVFVIGAGLGTIVFAYEPRWAMFPPVVFLIWIVCQDVKRPIAEIEPSAMFKDSGLSAMVAIYHLRKDVHRKGKFHRMPNLLVWADRLPPDVRVVVLDVAEVSELDSNSSLELRAVLKRLSDSNRRLIIAGVGSTQYNQILAGGAGDLLNPENVCPDLELAIARAMNVLDELVAHPGK